MKKSGQRAPVKPRRKQGRKMTMGNDDEKNNSSRGDYFVAKSLELTPHRNKGLRSYIQPPIMKPQLKYCNLETSLTGSNSTSATPLALITSSQGTTDTQHIGDRIRLRRLWISGKITGNAAATGPITSRILIVLYNPVGPGAVNAPTSGMVLQGSASNLPYAPYSRDFGDTYQVVYDFVTYTNPVTSSAEVQMFHLDREVLADCVFTAAASTPSVNQLYIFHLTDSGINQPSVVFAATAWFSDNDA